MLKEMRRTLFHKEIWSMRDQRYERDLQVQETGKLSIKYVTAWEQKKMKLKNIGNENYMILLWNFMQIFYDYFCIKL